MRRTTDAEVRQAKGATLDHARRHPCGGTTASAEHVLLRTALLGWYDEHRRHLPWREHPDPYRVLLSEVLLQQTRVQQAHGYYTRFLERFPTLEALALANEDAVMAAWAGAGYYARARRLHVLAQQVTPGGLPSTYEELRKLPGIGPYTAAAVASIAFGERVAAVDGNVRRVLCRLRRWPKPTTATLQNVAQDLLDTSRPGTWNQAMMELGALVCTPRRPACPSCPLSPWCSGRDAPDRFPQRHRRQARAVHAVALVLHGRGGVVLERRQGSMLGGLWGIPYSEGRSAITELLESFALREARFVGHVHHSFTHKRLTVEVYTATVDLPGDNPAERPLSRLDEKILALEEAYTRSTTDGPLTGPRSPPAVGPRHPELHLRPG